MSAIQYVIFDCDGVLVDSEALASEAWRLFLEDHGFSMSLAEINSRFAGKTDGMIRDLMLTEHQLELPEDTADRIEDTALKLFDGQLRAIPHVAQAIRDVRLPKSVCTNSRGKRLKASLMATGLYDLFSPDRLFHSQLVRHPKPAPDLHLHAAQSAGYVPAQTVVIEDSVTGVTAAKAAGMRSFGFVGAAHCSPDQADKLLSAGAELVFDDMRELGKHIQQSRLNQ